MAMNGTKGPIFSRGARGAKAAMGMALALMLALVVACAKDKDRPKHFSGFLGDYSALKKVAGAKADFLYRKPGVNLANYDRIMVDPVAIFHNPQSQLQAPDPLDITRLAVIFQNALTDAIGRTYPVTLRPGPRTLRLRGAMVNLEMYDPIPNLVSPAMLKFSLTTQRAHIEAEILDSVTNERLAAMVTVKQENRFIDPRSHAYPALTQWRQVEGDFRLWAQQFNAHLGFLYGKK